MCVSVVYVCDMEECVYAVCVCGGIYSVWGVCVCMCVDGMWHAPTPVCMCTEVRGGCQVSSFLSLSTYFCGDRVPTLARLPGRKPLGSTPTANRPPALGFWAHMTVPGLTLRSLCLYCIHLTHGAISLA